MGSTSTMAKSAVPPSKDMSNPFTKAEVHASTSTANQSDGAGEAIWSIFQMLFTAKLSFTVLVMSSDEEAELCVDDILRELEEEDKKLLQNT